MLAQTFGLEFRGVSRGENIINRFTAHPITKGLSEIPYDVGSGLFGAPPSATILGYLSESTFIDLNDNRVQDPGEPSCAPVMGVMRFGKGQIFFMGDTNTIEDVPQPLVDNLLQFVRLPIPAGRPSVGIPTTLAAQPPIAGKLVAVEGTVSVEGAQLPPGYLRVILDPLGPGNELSAEVRSDGTFTIGSVIPGHWRLSGSGVFIKSVTRGEREVSASDIEIGAQAGPPLKIVASTNFALLRVTAPSQPPSTEGILFFFWIGGGPDGPMFPVSGDHSSRMVQGGAIGLPPGRHLVCAFVGVQPWMTPQSSSDFRALRPALESHCQTVELFEAGETTVQAVQAPLISAEELKRLREKLEQ